jgi:hypothetical protein
MASPFYQCLPKLCKSNPKVIAVRKILLKYVVGKMDWSWAAETICLAHVLPCYRSHMVLGKEVLNGMTVAPANGGTVVQIHVSQRQSGALE